MGDAAWENATIVNVCTSRLQNLCFGSGPIEVLIQPCLSIR